MKLPLALRLPLVSLCAANAGALIAGFAENWLPAYCGAVIVTVALCWLVRAAYAQGHVDGMSPRRNHCTMAEVARYQRAVRRAWPQQH